MKDIDIACNVAKWKAGESAITGGEYDTTEKLLREYGDAREKLLNEMLDLLSKYDVSDIQSDWKDRCSRGKDLLAKLDDSIPNSDRLTGYGLEKFRVGENKIWEKNGEAKIALAAFMIQTIYLTNLKLIQDCNEELKYVMSGEGEIQKLAEGSFAATKDVAAKTLTFLYGIIQIKRYTGKPSIPDQVKAMGDQLKQTFSDVKKATEQKQALLKVLLARLELLKQVREKLEERAITDARNDGVAVAQSLQGVGQDSPYDAADWKEFGENCCSKLEENCKRSIEQSNTLFQMLYYRLDEETAKSFEALSDDPSQQERWTREIGDTFSSIQEALDNEQKYADTLEEGPIRNGLNADIATAKSWIKLYIDDWKSTVDNIKQALRRS